MTLKFGILGDSDTDSYRGDDDRGGDFSHVTFCVPEILVRLRSFDLGTWGSYAEPRRTDYAHNWSRSGATSHTMISAGQHTGLAAQVSNGDVDYCFIDIGTNNFHPGHSSPSLYDEVYDGTLSGSALQDEIDDCIEDMEDAMDALINAGAAGVVVALWHQWSDELAAAFGFTNGTNRQRVTDTIDDINAGIISACNSRGIPYVGTWDDLLDWAGGVQGTAPNEYVEIGGRQITLTLGDEPTNFQLSDTHMGTVAQCVMTNEMVIRPLNEHYDAGIAMLTEAEMLGIAGLLFPTTPVLDDFNRANGALTGDWDTLVPGLGVSGLTIASNEVRNTTSGLGGEYRTDGPTGADCEAYCTIPTLPGNGDYVALGVRLVDPSIASGYDGYDVVYTASSGTDSIELRRSDNASPTVLDSVSMDLSAGDKLGIRAEGNVIMAYVDDGDGWVQVMSEEDSTYSSGGYLALAIFDSDARVDDFGGGSVVDEVVVSAGPGSVSVVGVQATVDVAAAAVSVDASPGVVSVVGVGASVSATTTVAAGPATVAVVGVPATVDVADAAVSVDASPATVQVVGVGASVIVPIVVPASSGLVQVVGVGAAVVISGDVVVLASPGVVNVVGVPVFVDTVRYLLDLAVVDSAVYSVGLQDEAPYSVELVDASRS